MSSGLTLSKFLDIEFTKYLDQRKEVGGNCSGFLSFVTEGMKDDPPKYLGFFYEAVREAAKRRWEKTPRQSGPDLFSINGETEPSHYTRLASRYVDGEELENKGEDGFEKVAQQYATINDMRDDALIKMRKAAQS